tara:strand:+ start:1087 stop:1356 length:270 start_codon:yes stop_codon:yes gene_type:complete
MKFSKKKIKQGKPSKQVHKIKASIKSLVRNIKQKEIEVKRLNNELLRRNSRTNRNIINNIQKMERARPKLSFKKRRKMKKVLNQANIQY